MAFSKGYGVQGRFLRTEKGANIKTMLKKGKNLD